MIDEGESVLYIHHVQLNDILIILFRIILTYIVESIESVSHKSLTIQEQRQWMKTFNIF